MSVTDEQARAIVSKGDVHVFPCAVGDLAADLLDARSALRAVCEAAVAYVHHGFDDSDEERDLDAALAAARKLL